jgi:hypothetical protein
MFNWAGIWSGPSPNQTWTWDGGNWSEVHTAAQPSGNSGFAAMAFDPAAKSVVFFQHTEMGEPSTWLFSGTNWLPVTTSGSSSKTFVVAADEARSDVVLYGENGDTWTWDGSHWKPANPTHSPGPRQGMSLAYDAVNRMVVLFGGHSGSGSSVQPHNDIWNWDGSDWVKVAGS